MERLAINPAGWAQITPYDFVRVALAAILLVAAGLKCHQLATSPVLGDGLLDSRWVLMATVEFELFFGLWLLSGLLPRLTCATALVCFSLFACVSLYKALSGAASCGCFGRVPVNPWYTFMLDVACVLALLRWRPSGVMFTPSRTLLLRGAVVILSWLMVGVPAAVAIGTYQPAILAEDGVILGNDNPVILEPEEWIGKQFPLVPYIEDVPNTSRQGERPLRERLVEGNWIVLLYHHDCPECQKAIMKYKTLARRSALDPRTPRVAFLEVPPFREGGSLQSSPDAQYALGRLNNHKEWFVKTPAIFELVDGLVSSRGIQEMQAGVFPHGYRQLIGVGEVFTRSLCVSANRRSSTGG